MNNMFRLNYPGGFGIFLLQISIMPLMKSGLSTTPYPRTSQRNICLFWVHVENDTTAIQDGEFMVCLWFTACRFCTTRCCGGIRWFQSRILFITVCTGSLESLSGLGAATWAATNLRLLINWYTYIIALFGIMVSANEELPRFGLSMRCGRDSKEKGISRGDTFPYVF